jgi:hypothetical protein
VYLVAEWAAFLQLAWYLDQVTGAGTGVRRHPFFFLGKKRMGAGVASDSDDAAVSGKAGGWEAAGETPPQRKPWWRCQRRHDMVPVALYKEGSPKPEPASTLDHAPSFSTGLEPPVSEQQQQQQSERRQPEDDLLSPLDYYYGAASAPALASPQLPLSRQPGSGTSGGFSFPSPVPVPRFQQHSWQQQQLRQAKAQQVTESEKEGEGRQEEIVAEPLFQAAEGHGVDRKPSSVRLSLTPEKADTDNATQHSKEQRLERPQEWQEGPDVAAERARVDALWQRWCAKGANNGSPSLPSMPFSFPPMAPAAILLRSLRKVYPGRDGEPPKAAVADLSLAISRGECFGLLGPNGAGASLS